MIKYISVQQSDDKLLGIHSMGHESNGSLAHWGPGVRNFFILHYVMEGKGYFNGSLVTKGNGFLICPNKLHEYHSDDNDPWKYFWIIFEGTQAVKLLNNIGMIATPHIFSYSFGEKLINYINQLFSENNYIVTDLFGQGCFFILMSYHKESMVKLKKISNREQHVQNAVEFMKSNYHRRLKISDVSKHIFLNSQYMYNLFMEYIGISPKEYLNMLRIENACELLKSNCLSMSQIAESVGYSDSLQFSKFFKSQKGISPQEYRRLNDF